MKMSNVVKKQGYVFNFDGYTICVKPLDNEIIVRNIEGLSVKYRPLRDRFNDICLPVSKDKALIIQPRCQSQSINSFSSIADMYIGLLHYNPQTYGKPKREVMYSEILLELNF